MNPISTQFSTVPFSTIRTLHSAIKDKLPFEEIKPYFNSRSVNEKIDGMLPLDLAVLNNDEELIVELINAGAKFEDDEAAFQEFCQEGHVERVRALIENNRIHRGRNFTNALTVASIGNKIETVRVLLNWNPSIPKKGTSVAHAVCLLGHFEILKLLIEIGGVDVNDQNDPKTGNTFLITAATKGAIDFVKWLLAKGANPQIRCLKGTTPFLVACEGGFLQLAQHLYAVCKAKLGKAQNFLNTQYTEGHFTVLHIATLEGRIEVIKWLLQEGANPFNKGLDEVTPWDFAGNSCSLEIIKAFYESGKINLNKNKSKDKTTILHYCSEYGKPEVIRWLLENGADRLLLDDYKETPIECAFNREKEENVKAFIDKDFLNINQVYGIYKYTPLSLAVKNRMYPLVKWLLDNGADPSIEITDGHTSFTLACCMGELRTAQLLYEHSKSPKSNFKLDLNKHYGPYGITTLMAAYKYPDVIKWLLDNGADPFRKEDKGYTLFSASCKFGELDSAKIIFQLGIDLNQRYGEEEITALHVATIKDSEQKTAALQAAKLKERAEVVKFLIENGADPFIKDKSGKTPLEYAIEQKDIEIIKAYINALRLKIDSDLAVIKFVDVVFPLLDFLLKNGIALSTFELSIQDHFPLSLKNGIKVLRLYSNLINWVIKEDSKRISEIIEPFIAFDVEGKLAPLKDTKLTSNLGQEILDHFIPFLYKQFPPLKSEKPGLISVNKELFHVIREIVFKYKWMCDIQYNINIKLKVKSETSLEKFFEFIITLYNTLQQQRAIIASGNTNDTIAIAAKPETKVVPKPAEPTPQIKPAKPQHISSSPSVNVPITPKKPVKNKKRKEKQKQKGSAPKPQVITTAAHQKEHPSQVIVTAEIPLPPLFPPQIIPLKTPGFDLESLVVDSSQPHKEDHQLSELKKILSNPEPLHLSLFDEVCKINRDHHQVPGFFKFDSWLIHSSHKIFHSDVMCDLFLQFVKQGYQDPFKPEQLLESFSTKHFIDELAKIEGDRKQTIRNMIKILPSLSSRHAISAAILIIGEQTARSTDELSDIIDICMKYKVYRNLRHRLENQPEAVPFEREGVIEEGLINPGADWEDLLNELINELPADLEKLKNSKIMKD